MTRIRKQALTLAGIVAVGFVLAACDKCGNLFGRPSAEIQSCREGPPAQR